MIFKVDSDRSLLRTRLGRLSSDKYFFQLSNNHYTLRYQRTLGWTLLW